MKLLLIEDNLSHKAMMEEMLAKARGLSFTLTHANTLGKGLDILRTANFDIVLLDLELPDSTGFDTFAKAFAAAGPTPIIVLSGVDDEELAVETVKVGAQDYLVKSQINHHWLIRSIRYAFERAHVEQELKATQIELERRVGERTVSLREANERLKKEIIDRERVETLLKDSNRQLAGALEKMRPRSGGIGAASASAIDPQFIHDLRNALTPVMGFTDFLLMSPDHLDDSKTARRYLEKIQTAAREAVSLLGKKSPASETDPTHEQPPSNEQSMDSIQPKAKGSRLLVVEDDHLVRDIIGIYLREDGHQVTFAEDGLDGLDKFKDGTFDAVLTDRSMPGINGDQLAQEIKAIAPEMKIVLLTGYGEMMAAANERPAGIDLVVGKPFSVHDLRKAIQSVVG